MVKTQVRHQLKIDVNLGIKDRMMLFADWSTCLVIK